MLNNQKKINLSYGEREVTSVDREQIKKLIKKRTSIINLNLLWEIEKIRIFHIKTNEEFAIIIGKGRGGLWYDLWVVIHKIDGKKEEWDLSRIYNDIPEGAFNKESVYEKQKDVIEYLKDLIHREKEITSLQEINQNLNEQLRVVYEKLTNWQKLEKQKDILQKQLNKAKEANNLQIIKQWEKKLENKQKEITELAKQQQLITQAEIISKQK